MAHLDTFAAALQGFTPLFHAVIGNCADVVAALLSQGADVNAKDPKVNQTCHIASGSLTCLAYVLLVPDINVIDRDGNLECAWQTDWAMGAARLHQLCRMLPSSVIIVTTMDVYPTQTLLHCYDAVGIAC